MDSFEKLVDRTVIPSERSESRDPLNSPESIEFSTFTYFGGSFDSASLRDASLRMTF